jgi:N-methylhydantoinase B
MGTPATDTSASTVDAVLTAIVQGTLASVQAEMTATLRQSGRSNVATIARDYSHAIFDEHAEMILQGEDLPAHLGSLMFGVKGVAAYFGDDIKPGDVFYHNDPACGGSHLPDMCAYLPVFIDDQLTFWAVSKLHVVDAGGPVPGSYNRDATDMFAEGLRIPPLRIVDGGEVRQDVLNLILANIRSPEHQSGDIRAQLGAVRVAERRLTEVCKKYGRDAVRRCSTELQDLADREMRSLIARVPDGVARGSALLEDIGHGLGDVELVAEVTITGEHLHIRLESPPQVPFYVNSYEANTVSGVYLGLIMWAQLAPPYNAGLYRSVSVDCGPEGTILNARIPAAHVLSTSVPNENIAVAVHAALTAAYPMRQIGAWGSSYGLKLSGPDPRSHEGKRFVYNFVGALISGTGAIDDVMDGWPTSGPANCMGGLTCGDTELIEAVYPLVLHRYEIREDSGGAGLWRGGCGNRITIEPLVPMEVATTGQGYKLPAPGVGGAHNSMPERKTAASLIERADGTQEPILTNTRFALEPRDLYTSVNPGGGGCGDPFTRPPEKVLADVVNHFVSVEAAEAEYGVVLRVGASGRLELDDDATAVLRSAPKSPSEPRMAH